MSESHSMLMRAAAEKDIHHAPLGALVSFLEANLDKEKAAEAVELLHAAISPVHAARRHREAAEAVAASSEESVTDSSAEDEARDGQEPTPKAPDAPRKPKSKPHSK